MQINTKDFLSALIAGSVFSGKSKVLPILDCVKVSFKAGTGKIISSDTENTICIKFEANDNEYDEKSFCVNAKDIVSYVKLINDPFVDIVIDGMELIVKHKGGKKKMPIMDDLNFPVVKKEEYKSVNILSRELIDYLKSAVMFVASDELRPVMNGVCFDVRGGKLTTCATDGTALYVRRHESVLEEIGDTSMIINSNGIKSMLSLLSGSENASLKIGENNVIVSTLSGTISLRLIDGRYPNYNSVIPVSSRVELSFCKDDAIRAINMASLSTNASGLIKLVVDGDRLSFIAEDIDFSKSGEEYIECKSNENITIGFKSLFLQKCLSAISTKQCVMRLESDSRAALIYNDGDSPDDTILLMPMMIH